MFLSNYQSRIYLLIILIIIFSFVFEAAPFELSYHDNEVAT